MSDGYIAFCLAATQRSVTTRNHSGLVRDGEVGGVGLSGSGIVHTYSLHCHHQIDSALRWAPVSHFDVSLIVWARSQ